MVNQDLIVQKAKEEIEIPQFGTTQQFFKIHKIVRVNGDPEVLRIDAEQDDKVIIVYFGVEGEDFNFAIYLNSKSEVIWTGTESRNRVYFGATSEILSFEELASLTSLTPTKGWNKGDLRSNGKSKYTFSCLEFLINPEPDAFDDKIEKLLTFLEQDKNGIRKLVEKSDGYIQVAMNFHNGNTMLGGAHLNKDIIRRMSDLNLAIDFDLYAEGNSFIG